MHKKTCGLYVRGFTPEMLEMIIHTMKDRGSMWLRYKKRGQLLLRDVTITRLTVFFSFGMVRRCASATAAGWGQ